MPRWTNRRALAATATALFAVTPAACGGEDEPTTGVAASPTSFEMQVGETGRGGAFTIPEKTVKAGVVEVNLRNDGKQPHSAQIIKLEDGHTAEDAIKVLGSDPSKTGIPEWMRAGGGVGPVKPGTTETSTEVLEAGTYAVIDDEARAKPAHATFEVTGKPVSTTLPNVGSKITAKDYSFTTSGLKSGKNEVLVENTGKELHHVVALPMVEGATIGQVTEFFRTEKGKPPVSEEGGDSTPVLDGGKSQVAQLELKKGKYALVCFISDRKGGPPHVAKGMIAEATVK